MTKNRPISPKLDPDIRDRVMELAKAQNRSTDELIREALTQYADREERREALRQDALHAWERYQRTGIHATQREADGRMAELESDCEPASRFYERLSANCGTDIYLEAVIRESRANPREP